MEQKNPEFQTVDFEEKKRRINYLCVSGIFQSLLHYDWVSR